MKVYTAQLYCQSWLCKWVHSTVNTEGKKKEWTCKDSMFWNSIMKGMLENKEVRRSFGIEQMGFETSISPPQPPSFLLVLSKKKLWMIKGIKGSRNGAQENLVLIEEFPVMAGNSCHFCRVHFLPPHSFLLSFSLFPTVIIHKWPNKVAHMSYPNKCSHPILDQQTQLIHYVRSREKVHKNIRQDNYFQR